MTTNAKAVAEGQLRPPPSDRYDSPMTRFPSFSRHEGASDGPHIEASVQSLYRNGAYSLIARVNLDIDGEHGCAYVNADASAKWCREAAAVLLDVADAVEMEQKNQIDHVEGTHWGK